MSLTKLERLKFYSAGWRAGSGGQAQQNEMSDYVAGYMAGRQAYEAARATFADKLQISVSDLLDTVTG